MKKLLITIMLFMLVMLVGCGNNNNQYALKEGATLEDIVNRVEEELILTKTEKLNDETICDILDIELTDIDEYNGVMSNNMMGGDAFIILKAKPTTTEAIKEKTEEYKAAVIRQQYLPAEVEKANLSSIYVKGEYIAYILLGNAFTTEFDQEETKKYIDDAKLIIDEYLIKK